MFNKRNFFFLLYGLLIIKDSFCIENTVLKDSYYHVVQENPNGFPETTCQLGPRTFRISARYNSKEGIGLQDVGYTTFEAFVGSQGQKSGLVFANGSAHLFDDGKWAANGGIGLRVRCDSWKFVLGTNAYYDYRRNVKHNYHQTGAGIELLWDIIKFRANGYIPFGVKKKFRKATFNRFERNHIILNREDRISMFGADAELEARLIKYGPFELKTAWGSYYFKGSFGKHAWGSKGRLTMSIFDTLYASAKGYYDKLFKFNIQAEAKLSVSLGPRTKPKKRTSHSAPSNLTCASDYSMMKRLVEPVQRQEIIVLSDQTKQVVAMGFNCQPLFFLHVNNSFLGTNLGTFENPFSSFSQLVANYGKGDFIYVNPGNRTTTGMSAGITLLSDQTFLGSGTNQNILTNLQIVFLPAQTPGVLPTITNTTSNGSGITLADGNTVSGFNITGTQEHGITIINPLRGSKILNNRITQFSAEGGGQDHGGINIDVNGGISISGSFEIKNNFFSSSNTNANGLLIDLSEAPSAGEIIFNIDMQNNIISNVVENGMRVTRSSGANNCKLIGAISNNQFLSNSSEAFIIDHTGGTIMILDLVFDNNRFISNGGEGIEIDDMQGNLTISNNLVQQNGGSAGVNLRVNGTNSANINVFNNRYINNSPTNGFFTDVNNSAFARITFEGNTAINDEFTITETGPSATIELRLKNNSGVLNLTGDIILID